MSDNVCNYCIDTKNVMACYSNPKECGEYKKLKRRMKMKVKRIFNKKGLIVACLYIKSNGNLHPDSWFSLNGWA